MPVSPHAFTDPTPDTVIEWYEENAKAAAEIMLPGTKGHMLAAEAIPRLVAEVRMLRRMLREACQHPNYVLGACAVCGQPENGEGDRPISGTSPEGGGDGRS